MGVAERAGLSASLEDYLEAIFNITQQCDVARSRDIAELLGVSKASVTGALRALKKKGLANYKPYDYVTLTEKGQQVAAEIAGRHRILRSFFVEVLGVDKTAAQQAACKAEHTLGPEIIGKLLHFIEFVTQQGHDGRNLAAEFRAFCKSKGL